MAFQAGLLNIGGFLACHRFVSHVTGFATYFGRDVSHFDFGHALGMLTVPLFFLFGSMLSGQLVDIPITLNKNPRYFVAFGVLFCLILATYLGGISGLFGTFGEAVALPRDYALLGLLCLACGVQNGTITSVSRSVVRTTHLTGITTDLGIGLVRILNRKHLGTTTRDDRNANLMRIGIILSFGLGSVVGAFVFRRHHYSAFLLPTITSGLLFTSMLYFQVLKRRHHAK